MSLMQDQIEALRQANAQREEEMRRPQTLRWELGTASTCKCEVGMIFDASAPVTITSHPYFYKRPWVPFLRTYRNMCIAPEASFRQLLQEVGEMRLAA